LWNQVVAEAKSNVRMAPLDIKGGDIDFRAVSIVEKSIKKLKMKDSISIRRISFDKFMPKTNDGMIIVNPPYGERIGENVDELYKLFGDILKNNFHGFDAWILSSNMAAFKQLHLRASKKIVLFNGSLECKFQKYEMYQGSRDK
jgi:putative N6-adenine-specific DNA methylase